MITQKIIARTDSLKLDKIISRYGEDSMRQVVFIIVRPDPESEELIPITIPEDAVGSFRILKPSGNFVIVPMSKSILATGETAFDVVLPASANTAKGSGYYDIRITSDTDKYYFTAQGDFLIDDNIISDDVLEDVSEVNGLIFPDDFLTVEDHVAYIDDETESTDSTWSSDKISEEIEAHAGSDVSKTVSGNPVTFTDGASAPLVKCVTTIQGNQDLHGYDKPWVGGAGKNKFGGTYNEFFPLHFSSDTTITASADSVSGVTPQIAYYDENYTRIDYWGLSAQYSSVSGRISRTFLYPNTAYYVKFITNESTNYQIEIANANTAFTPYSNICPITAYTEGEIEVRGKNLFDKNANDIAVGYYLIASTGVLSPSQSGYNTSGYIPIEPNTYYTKSGASVTADEYCFYDSAKTFISGISRTDTTVLSPNNAAYMRFDYKASETDNIQIEKGSTATPYEPYTSTTHTTTYPSAIYRGSEDVVNGEVTTEWGMIASYAGETLPGEWISDRDEYAPGTTPTTGAQVAYALATPTTSSVTPTNLPIKSLFGYNHIESSTGDMEIEYITEEFQPLIDSIKQL